MGAGRDGRNLQDMWRAKGFSEEEIEKKNRARMDLIKAVRARTMAQRKENQALTLGLGDAAIVATTIESKRKELSREFKLSSRKGVITPRSAQKKAEQMSNKVKKDHDRAYNPRIKGLDGIPGLNTAEDGTIGLAELREQRPDIFDMKPMPVAGSKQSDRIRKLKELIEKSGRKDHYGHIFD